MVTVGEGVDHVLLLGVVLAEHVQEFASQRLPLLVPARGVGQRVGDSQRKPLDLPVFLAHHRRCATLARGPLKGRKEDLLHPDVMLQPRTELGEEMIRLSHAP